jgi:2-hydroxychromene-2-carboxylate isomerase
MVMTQAAATDAPQFLFDFASPNAFLAWRALPAIEKRTGVAFAAVPVLFGGIFKLTGNQAPMIANAGVPAKLAYEQLEMRRFIARHDIPFTFNPHFPVNTLLLMRMATAADMDGALASFVNATFPLMWEAPQKMDDAAIAVAALEKAGVNAQRYADRAQEADVKARLMEATQRAVDRGVFGIPSFLVGDALYFGKNTLPEVEETILAARVSRGNS